MSSLQLYMYHQTVPFLKAVNDSNTKHTNRGETPEHVGFRLWSFTKFLSFLHDIHRVLRVVTKSVLPVLPLLKEKTYYIKHRSKQEVDRCPTTTSQEVEQMLWGLRQAWTLSNNPYSQQTLGANFKRYSDRQVLQSQSQTWTKPINVTIRMTQLNCWCVSNVVDTTAIKFTAQTTLPETITLCLVLGETSVWTEQLAREGVTLCWSITRVDWE